MRSIDSTWNGKLVSASAYLVPRYAWMTASIDVKVEDQVVLRTGGVPKLQGDVPTSFVLNGVQHTIKVSWGKASLKHFPVVVSIDDTEVMCGNVPIANWWLNCWPWALIVIACVWLNLK
jgi:hypothetical protein